MINLRQVNNLGSDKVPKGNPKSQTGSRSLCSPFFLLTHSQQSTHIFAGNESTAASSVGYNSITESRFVRSSNVRTMAFAPEHFSSALRSFAHVCSSANSPIPAL